MTVPPQHVRRTSQSVFVAGIFDACNKTAPNINHAVVLDGYGVENGTKYWLIRTGSGRKPRGTKLIRMRGIRGETTLENAAAGAATQASCAFPFSTWSFFCKATYDFVDMTTSPAAKIQTLSKVLAARPEPERR